MCSVMLTYFLLKSIDMLLFTVCVVTVYKHLISKLLIRNNEGPVPRTDVSGVGRCCIHNERRGVVGTERTT